MLAALLALLMAAPTNVMVCAPSKTDGRECALKTEHTVKYYTCVRTGKHDTCTAK